MAENLHIPNSEKWITPNRVPKPEYIRILPTDPRNNSEFLEKNTNVIVLTDFSFQPGNNNNIDFTLDDSSFLPEDPPANSEPPVNDTKVILPPTNLSISNFELHLNAGDGNFFYTANLNFDIPTNAVAWKASQPKGVS